MKKKKIIIIAGVLVVAAVGGYLLLGGNKTAGPIPVTTSSLTKTSLRSTINTSGNVESVDSVNIYSDVAAPVKTIAVKVGDKVKAGDILCELDTEKLNEQIEAKALSIRDTKTLSANTIKNSQRDYSQAKNTLDKGLNTSVNSAQQQLVSAQRGLEDAKQKQADAQRGLDSNLNTELISARNSVTEASKALDRAETNYRQFKDDGYYKDLKDIVTTQKAVVSQKRKDVAAAKDPAEKETLQKQLYEEEQKLQQYQDDLDNYTGDNMVIMPGGGEVSIKSLSQAVEDAETNLKLANKNLQAVQDKIDTQMKSYNTAVEDAQIVVDNAQKSLDAAQTGVKQDLQRNLDSIATAKLQSNTEAAEIDLENMKKDLDKCQVKATADGTVTAIYAEEGETANGLMFIIEDTQSLMIKVRIKEYDINTVKEGMKVALTADATGEDEYEGVVQRISPTAVKLPLTTNNNDATQKNNDVEFEAEILITSANTRLRIGMSANADIIIEERNDIYAVPYEELGVDETGASVIYIPKQQADGTYLSEAVPVTLGLESDYAVEITGEGLTDGMPVIADSKAFVPGVPFSVPGLNPTDGTASNGDSAASSQEGAA